MIYGATTDDWQACQRAGLTTDLLPTVCRPGQQIHPDSKLKSYAKVPSRYTDSRLVVGIPAWAKAQSTERQVSVWAAETDYGICLQTRRVRAIDIDIGDADHARSVLETIEMILGPVECRYRENSGKLLVPLWVDGGPALIPKAIVRTQHGIVEFLGDGQQFVAFGTHDSGVRYEMTQPDPAKWSRASYAEWCAVRDAIKDAFAISGVNESRGTVPAVPRTEDAIAQGDYIVTYLRENGLVLDSDRQGRHFISCPWKHEHTSDSGITETAYFPRGVGGYEQGHFRCLHAHCAGRTDRDYMDALGITEVLHGEGFEEVDGLATAASIVEQGPVALPALDGSTSSMLAWEEPAEVAIFSRDRRGLVEPTLMNAALALARPSVCKSHIAFDRFKGQILVHEIEGEYAGVWRVLDDAVAARLRIALERFGFKTAGKELVRDAIEVVAHDHAFDSAQQWLDGLVWDGQPRVDTFLHRLFGAADSAYTRAVSRYWWTAAAGRIVTPGLQCDMAPVLCGGQGVGKTTALRALVPTLAEYGQIDLSHRDADLCRSLRGKLIADLDELRGLRSRDAEAIKAWVTRTADEWVPKYKEHTVSQLRRFLLVGTTNSDDFLADEHGEERRWLPVRVGLGLRFGEHLDVAAFGAEASQLWAEGRVLYEAHGVLWREANATAAEARAEHTESDVVDDAVAAWINRGGIDGGPISGDFSLYEVILQVFGRRADDVDRKLMLRVGAALRRLGGSKIVAKDGGRSVKRWRVGRN